MSEAALFAYLFVIDSSTMSRDAAVEIIDKMPMVVNWEKILPDAVVLVSAAEVGELHAALKEKLPGQRYILSLLEKGKKQGWLARDSWGMINKPTAVADSSNSLI